MQSRFIDNHNQNYEKLQIFKDNNKQAIQMKSIFRLNENQDFQALNSSLNII